MSVTLPAGVFSPAFKAPTPGGVFQDDFAIGATGDLAGRVAAGTNGGWTWGHVGPTPDAYNVKHTATLEGLYADVGGSGDRFYYDVGDADQFFELEYSSVANNLRREGGVLLRDNGTVSLMCELRFGTQCRVFVATGSSLGANNYISPAPSVLSGDTVRLSITGDVITFWTNDVADGTLDVSAWYGANPSLQTATRVGLFTNNFIATNFRARNCRLGAGDGT